MNRQETGHTCVTFFPGEWEETYLAFLDFPITEFYLCDWYYFFKEDTYFQLLFAL